MVNWEFGDVIGLGYFLFGRIKVCHNFVSFLKIFTGYIILVLSLIELCIWL